MDRQPLHQIGGRESVCCRLRMGGVVILMSLFLFLLLFTPTTYGSLSIGTAGSYDPPYSPTRCYGNEADQFPADNFFVSVSQEKWEAGAACGRRYRLKCLSGINHRSCIDNAIDVVVVDVCSAGRKLHSCPTFLLPNDAFSAISNSQTDKLNVEYIGI